MPVYQCCILENDGKSIASLSFDCDSNAEAQDYTLRLFGEHPHANNVELWINTRLLLSYARSGMPRSALELRALCARVLEAAHDETDPGIKRTVAAYAFSLAEEAEALELHPPE
ncbi:MAG TPA: hypothetical protein VK759_02335 [Rhizomicrobium sp.]|nr:hypothetical protein [Rhizomicrobium sp.]